MAIFKTWTVVLLYLIIICKPLQAKSQATNESSTQAKAKELLLDTILTIFQTSSIYKDKANWVDLRYQLYKSIDTSEPNSAKAIIPAYKKLAKVLNITHGGLTYKGESYGALNEGYREMYNRIPNTIQEAAGKKEYNFRVEVIGKKNGYISIPPIDIKFSEDMEKVKQELTSKASLIQDSLCKLNSSGVKGIIIPVLAGSNMNLTLKESVHAGSAV
jgi:hypothetical protein